MWEELFPNEDPKKVREALDNARKWESRAKENFEKAQLVDDLKAFKADAQATLDQATARITELETEVSTLNGSLSAKDIEVEKAKIAAAKKVPEKWLNGSTREELERSADEWLEDARSAAKPGGNPYQGTGDPNAQTTPYELGRERAEARYRKNN